MRERQILISAQTGDGIDNLLHKIEVQLLKTHQKYAIILPISEGKLAAWLHQNSVVDKVENFADENTYTVNISAENLSRLQKMIENSQDISIRKI